MRISGDTHTVPPAVCPLPRESNPAKGRAKPPHETRGAEALAGSSQFRLQSERLH